MSRNTLFSSMSPLDAIDEFMRQTGNEIMNSQVIKSPASRFGYMSTDILEEESAYEIVIDVPGFKKEDISITLNDNTIRVSVTNRIENDIESGKKYIRRERFYGEFSREFNLGDEVEVEEIKASHDNGVLTITVPKKINIVEEPQVKHIDIM